ncbi:MAG: malate dehydrogenase [Cyanobacteria bacterium J06642_12]
MEHSRVEHSRVEHSKVAVIGAGAVGSTLAQRIAETNLADVVLLDIVQGRPQGVALDLMEARAVERHDRSIVGTQDYADVAGADIVVITAGRPRTPNMTRDDLLGINAGIVAKVASQAIAQAPEAIFITVTNPLDVMAHLVGQVGQLSRERFMGMAGVLDAARFATFIAMELNVSAVDVSAMVLGGHGDLMLPLARYTTVGGVPLPELMSSETIDRIAQRTRQGGAEIGKLLKTGSAYYAPSASVAVMVDAILRDRHRMLPVSVALEGEYGLQGLCLGVPVQLGADGVETIIELTLMDAEMEALHESAASVKAQIGKLPDVG